MKFRINFVLVLLFLLQPLLALAATVDSKSDPIGKLNLATKRVVIFKDGYALFVKSARGVTDENGQLFLESVPGGVVLGSFWAHSKKHRILRMHAERVSKTVVEETSVTCTTIRELLRANRGKRVVLTLKEEGQTISAWIEDLLENASSPSKEQLPRAAAPSFSSYLSSTIDVLPVAVGSEGIERKLLSPRGGELVKLKLEDGSQLILPVSEIAHLSGKSLESRMVQREEVRTRSKRLRFDLGKAVAGKKVDLKILYFAEGVRWIPTYRLDLKSGNNSTLGLQAEVLNEAEDIEGAKVDFVVGVPNFRFKSVISPISLEQVMRNALPLAQPGVMGTQSQFQNALFTQRAGEHRVSHSQAGSGASGSEQLAFDGLAGQVHDLYVYQGNELSLKKGARAVIHLWTQEVKQKDVYTFDLQVVRDKRGSIWNSSNQNGALALSPLALSENKVWHQLELVNSGKGPWTTGAALVLKEGVPVAQELLTYTAAGSRTLLPLTVAVNLQATHKEQELDRQPNAYAWDRSQFTRILKEGKIVLINRSNRPEPIEVRVRTGGRVSEVSGKGKIEHDDHHPADWRNVSYGVNNHSDVHWEVVLTPGERREFTYKLEYYTR